jgi:hypothetical protein
MNIKTGTATDDRSSMNTGWLMFFGGIGAGLAFKKWAAALAFAIASGWWIIRDAEGRFVNHSGNGENFGAEALLTATGFCVIGWLGVLVGIILRLGAESVVRSK